MNENRLMDGQDRHKIIGGEWMKKTFSGLILWGRMNENRSMNSQTGIKSLGRMNENRFNGWPNRHKIIGGEWTKKTFSGLITLGANE